jgi:hypothetical protein
MHLKVFLKLKKPYKLLSLLGKYKKKKIPLGWFFFKNPGFFQPCIQAAQQRGQGSVQQVGGPGAQPDLLPMVSEIRESLNSVRRDLTNSYARQAQQGGGAAKDCPAPAACVTGTTVALLLGGQLILLLGYLMYRDSREASAKKFY